LIFENESFLNAANWGGYPQVWVSRPG
jgi:hypothetical protein